MSAGAPAEPFFLATADGPRFCMYHPPAGACRGALVYLHPFAEELNRTRRMAALGARALAAQGVAVLQIDLHGCGDSAGDFGDASWQGWKRDVAAAAAWLRARTALPVGLWGLRLGALLALDCARDAAIAPARLLLWQPVTRGNAFLTQFLRLRLAGDLLQDAASSAPAAPDQGGTEALRAALRAGETLEVAGYRVAPALALPLDALDAQALAPSCPVDWFELASAPERPLPPAAARLADAWRAQGVRVDTHLVAGPQFWATPEIAEVPALVLDSAALAATSWAASAPHEAAHEAAHEASHETAHEAPAAAGAAPDGMRALAFDCAGARLYGVLDVPPRPARQGVLVVVGGPQYRAGSHRQFTLLARRLAAAGIAAMRFDYRGMGDSEGAIRPFDTVHEDLRAAVDRFMEAVPQLESVVLWGLCDGASAAVLYAPHDARVAGLALLNPWVRTEEGAAKAMLKHYYRERLLDAALWKKIASGKFDYAGAARSFAKLAGTALAPRRGAPGSQVAEVEADPTPAALPERMHAALAAFPGRVLVMLSGADLTAREFGDLEQASRTWRATLAAPRVVRHLLPRADHTCSRREWQDQVEDWTRAWVLAGAAA
jgi:exosortase A-associated hydrolase 1/exosortase A-associated hydrolase 2